MDVLKIRNVRKVYGSRSGGAVEALAGVSLDVADGEFLGIMGPSGAGKSTLLHLAATLDKPDSGSILVDNLDLAGLRGKALAEFRRVKLGFIFQEYNLLDTLTLAENIALPLMVGKGAAGEIATKLQHVAESLGISDILGKYPYEVSGGQKQRCAAARAIIHEPRLLLADEPTGALDSRSSRDLLERMEHLNRHKGTTIFLVTHDPFAASFCKRMIFLKDGRLFTELQRGTQGRQEFFDRILQVQGALGGNHHEVAAARY